MSISDYSQGFDKNDVEQTALMVAAARAKETSKPEDERLINDPLAACLASHKGFQTLKTVDQLLKQWNAPKLTETISLRTKFIDVWIEERITEKKGISQVVFLGAGMDTRAFRLNCFKEMAERVTVFEVDMQHVLEYKNRVLELESAIPHCKRICVGVNMVQKKEAEGVIWGRELEKAGFDRNKKSLWILEGLIMYLDECEIQSLFKELSRLCCADSEILFNTLKKGTLNLYESKEFKERFPAKLKYFSTEPDEIFKGVVKNDWNVLKAVSMEEISRQFKGHSSNLMVNDFYVFAKKKPIA